MIYTLLDVAISPIEILAGSLGLIVGIALGVGIVIGATIYFIRRNKNKKENIDEE